jgi:hypothetical protein
MKKSVLFYGLALWVALPGCSVNVPFDPASSLSGLDSVLGTLQEGFADAVADPLQARPYPVLIGGDSQKIYYATSLTDIRLRFPGPTGDVVLPSLAGPSNLYRYADKQRELLRPLIPAGAFVGLATDGRFLAFLRVDASVEPPALRIVASDLIGTNERVVFDPVSAGATLASADLTLSAGRVAYAIEDDSGQRVRVEDLVGVEPAREIESEGFYSVALSGERLAYVSGSGGVYSIVLRDLATDAELVLASRIASVAPPRVLLTANQAVWSEPLDGATQRVWAYDFPTGETRVRADAVRGRLVGGSDEYLLTQESIRDGFSRPERIRVRRYDPQGREKQLAEFRASGLAGQARILGDRAVWVNPERRVVSAPLAGGDRTIFAPF